MNDETMIPLSVVFVPLSSRVVAFAVSWNSPAPAPRSIGWIQIAEVGHLVDQVVASAGYALPLPGPTAPATREGRDEALEGLDGAVHGAFRVENGGSKAGCAR